MRGGFLGALASSLPWAAGVYRYMAALQRDHGLRILGWARATSWFWRDYARLSREAPDAAHAPSLRYLDPYLGDRRATTPLDPVYFFQSTWAARKIFALGGRRHVDVGSSAMAIGIIAQNVPVTMVDIRPLELAVPGLDFRRGSVLALPFEDNSVESVSCLCVLEHIGLGRYGDGVDASGTEKALAELFRILGPGGHLLVSVPVDDQCRVYFNAHRAFTRPYLELLFERFEILDESYQYGAEVHERYDAKKGFGTGMFHLRKAAG